MTRLILLSLLLLPPLTRASDEVPCQEAFSAWMLEQHQIFANRQLGKMERRHAERSIDKARTLFNKSGDFCKTMAELEAFKDKDPRFTARGGEIHDFTPVL
ncbi:hypothetical protein [Aeromonas schubertii]|uniref:Uncharacterized protein n=1 Tax=Aeromonas schubertii TaxID=652 RepID=A0A0S2SIQ8_9GAMM|nr:hypothetical protein [Aeromonas schubertii]ALP41539.1 hypothetical protein WL1483_2120 [Aeromonas schubertii]